MLNFIIKKIIGDSNEREIKRMRGILDKVNALEPAMRKSSDGTLYSKTYEFKDRLKKGETLDDILPEAFALVREASRRVLGLRHFDVQILGGICLHEGKIAEMRTGEGKTLVATLAVYLNALTGKGVHMITVNDYLAKRDSEWMGKLYSSLGLTVGLIAHDMDFPLRKHAYNCDITFGTNNEFGFDYLRDNMVVSPEQMVQRNLSYAIIDEVDSILIDEARTPLIISGPGAKSTESYGIMAKAVEQLEEGVDYTVNEKEKNVTPTETAIPKIEKILKIKNLYDSSNIEMSHCFNQALRAKALMKRDRDYVVRDGEIVIVDEFTGRLMVGRRYSEGLHQAIEAKEGVKVQRESQTLASITFQNYFRMYDKIGGMTGTAKTEEAEFQKIYNLSTVVIPTNKPVQRIDHPDVIYKTKKAKMKAVINTILESHKKGQPVLVGTTSIEQSEDVSKELKKVGIDHKVLNAKYHEMEAEIIKDAGQKGSVTIATNMAGRGTDISLGEGVPELGGLYVIGTERHESRRIDNQLRGRAGRQGDPGESKFFLSLEDDLMRLFGSENIANIMDKLGMGEDDPIEHKLVTRSISQAQKKVEGRNFDIRKHVIEYDDVMNQQREVIYDQRRKILLGDNLKENILNMVNSIIKNQLDRYANEKSYPEEWLLNDLIKEAEEIYAPQGSLSLEELEELSRDEIRQKLEDVAADNYKSRELLFGEEIMRDLERIIMLKVLDSKWMDHLDNMDTLREGISLRAYGQKNPLIEYKIEGHEMFQNMIEEVQDDIAKIIYRVNLVQEKPETKDYLKGAKVNHSESISKSPQEKKDNIKRNEPCPCGSNKKYKNCCGK